MDSVNELLWKQVHIMIAGFGFLPIQKVKLGQQVGA